MNVSTKKVVRKKVKLPAHHTLGAYDYYLGVVVGSIINSSGPYFEKEAAFKLADEWAMFLLKKIGKDK
jgi:hypothetical protein